ncbi:MAG: N-acetylmuramoyl-L-alanine amidase [Lachnospiraceae bacterium]|nr:N-acetylmuramoyl-L-alanine amidase [Lachnospiraceae bacterium]
MKRKKYNSFFHNNGIIRCLTVFLAMILTVTCSMRGIVVYAQKAKPVNEDIDEDQTLLSENEENLSNSRNESIIVVIDPGHGGKNLGGEYEDYTEKEMTLVVAKAMKEELEKYDGITVYMTRTGDQELSLEERCDFAKDVDADFLFCLHFNLSGEHTLFGAECWVSAFGENYSKGYSFASVEIDMLQEMGLYSRGIKTRLNDRGTDYYGIIRHSVKNDLPCVLIEHCHLDHENDQPFYDHDQKLKDFGVLDATAVAKYFGLRSEELGVDYSDYQNVEVPIPSYVVAPDRTEPDICMIEVTDQIMETGEVTVSLSADDYDSGMLYYTYSYDNGEHFSALQRWPDKSIDTFSFTMQVPPHIVPQIVVNGYNGYDLYTTSNMVSLPSMDYKTKEEIAAELKEEALAIASSVITNIKGNDSEKKQDAEVIEIRDINPDDNRPVSFEYFLIVCIVCMLLVLGMVVSVILILHGMKQRRRKSRRKSEEDSWLEN